MGASRTQILRDRGSIRTKGDSGLPDRTAGIGCRGGARRPCPSGVRDTVLPALAAMLRPDEVSLSRPADTADTPHRPTMPTPSPTPSLTSGLVRLSRPQQWIKNLLVFVAPAAAGVLLHWTVLW